MAAPKIVLRPKRVRIRLAGEPADAPAEPALPAPTCPQLDSARAALDALEERACTEAGPWIEYWSQVEALSGVTAEPRLALEIDAFRERALTAARDALGVGNLSRCLPAARTLIAAANAVLNGQPKIDPWPSGLGRLVSAESIVSDYEAVKQALAGYAEKITRLDEAIKAARDAEVVWLLPEGGLRCPAGAKEVFCDLAAAAGLITAGDAAQEFVGLMRWLGMFSTPARSADVLASMQNPFKQEVVAYAKEAHAQLTLLSKAGANGDAGSLLAARPMRFRGVDIKSDSSAAYVIGTFFFGASAAVTAVVANQLPPLYTAAVGAGLFIVSLACAVVPARQAKTDHWRDAVTAAESAYGQLRDALIAKPKAPDARAKAGVESKSKSTTAASASTTP